SHFNQCSNSARSRGSPRGAESAGTTTTAANFSAAASLTPTCSASFESKWANRPLFDIPMSPATLPSDMPSRPSTLAARSAVSTMRERVVFPFAMTPIVRQIGRKGNRNDLQHFACVVEGSVVKVADHVELPRRHLFLF